MSEILEGEITDPQFTMCLQKQGSGCWKRKKKERKKKADKSSPCWSQTLFGVLDMEKCYWRIGSASGKRADSRQPHREQGPDLPTALGPQHRTVTSQRPRPSNDGKTSHCNTCFPRLVRHWFPYGEPQYSVRLSCRVSNVYFRPGTVYVCAH